MTIACPQCGAPAEFSSEPVSSSGRMMRCARCGTNWLGRLQAGNPYGDAAALRPVLQRGRPRFERIVEHVDRNFGATAATKGFGMAGGAQPKAKAPGLHAQKALRRGIAAWSGVGVAVLVAALVTATLLNSSDVDAASERGTGKFAGLEVRTIEGGLKVLRDGKAVAVTAEVVNRSAAALDVPAIRVALKANGSELYTWTVEPTTTRLAAGGSVQFRSALAASPAGIDEVAFRLADRREIVVGMR